MYPALKIISILFLFYRYPLILLVFWTILKQFRGDCWHRKFVFHANINVGILVSYCCCKKLPQTWWLKTTEFYFLTVWEARSLKSVSEVKVLAGLVPSGGVEENSFTCLFQFLEAVCISWLVASPPGSKCITPVCACVVTWLSLWPWFL